MAGMKTENVTNKVVMLGNNEFCAATITLDANQTLVAGAILKRGKGENEFEVAKSADTFSAVNPAEMKNETCAKKIFSFRALTAGRVRQDMLRVGTETVTAADIDRLRGVGIQPKKVTDLSHLDNQ